MDIIGLFQAVYIAQLRLLVELWLVWLIVVGTGLALYLILRKP